MFMTDLVIDIVISVVIAIFSAYINPVISHIKAWCIFHINPSISPNSRGAFRLDISWLSAGHSRPIHPGVLHLSEESRMGYGMRTLDSPYRRRRFQWHLSSTPPWRQAFRKRICKLGVGDHHSFYFNIPMKLVGLAILQTNIIFSDVFLMIMELF